MPTSYDGANYLIHKRPGYPDALRQHDLGHNTGSAAVEGCQSRGE